VKQTPRTLKLGESLREIIAGILATEVSDPRLEMVTVTGVQISSDLGVANIYVTAHGTTERYDEVLAGLESAKGRIRSLLGQQISLRVTPELRFFIDESIDEGQRIDLALQNVPPTISDDESVGE